VSVRPVVSRAIPWLVFGAVLMPAAATAIVGILILALWEAPSDIVLGVLTLVFAAFAVTGSIVAVSLLFRQTRLARAQAEFVAHVSHELRTPLASIRMYVDTLRMGRASADEAAEFLAALDAETARLAGMVEQLLGARDATAAGGEAAVPTDVAGVVLAAAVDPSGRVSTSIEPGLPPVRVRPEGLKGAVANLVRNALAYGDGSPVRVSVRGADGGVAIEVRDGGPGVAAADRQRIFRRFERGASTTDSGTPGLGLGLSIVKSFADAHGGRITLESEPGKGAAFTLWLPAR